MTYNYENLKEAARYTRISIPNEFFSNKEEMVEDFNRWADIAKDSLINNYKSWTETIYNEE